MVHLLRKSLILSFLIAVQSLALGQQTASEWFEEGRKLEKDKKLTDAILAYQHALDTDATYPSAQYKIGWCYNELRQFDKGISALQKALLTNQQDRLALEELGYAYKETNQLSLAKRVIDQSLAIKQSSNALFILGDVFRMSNQLDSALGAYKRAWVYNDKNSEALYFCGYIYNTKGDYNAALEWLRKSIAIKPKTKSYNELGFAFYKLKQNDSALAAYQQAQTMEPNNSTAYKGMGDLYRRNYSPAKTDLALAMYQKAVALNSTSAGSHYGVGWCLNEQKDYAGALSALQKSLALDSKLAPAYSEMGYAQYMLQQYVDAIGTLSKGLALEPSNANMWYYKGLVHIAQKDKTNAQLAIAQLAKIDARLADKLSAKTNAL